jgi:predicted DCC family thiol-disulfide oxidoreductase YuxK
METLRNHTLIYDGECPMCDLYTSGFVKTGLLDANGRVEYGCARVPVTFSSQRARDEIALVDYETGTVTYGLDSLLKIVGHSFPMLSKLLNLKIIRWLLSKLYFFISYNRKVIAPPKAFEKRGSCTPAYNPGYRIAYIIFAWLVVSLIGESFRAALFPLVIKGSRHYEFALVGGLIIFQMVIVRLMSPAKVLHYIGNMMTVTLIGSLLLLPLMIMNSFLTISPGLSEAWLATTVTFACYLHWTRVGMLAIPWMTVTLMAYVAFALWIYFNY